MSGNDVVHRQFVEPSDANETVVASPATVSGQVGPIPPPVPPPVAPPLAPPWPPQPPRYPPHSPRVRAPGPGFFALRGASIVYCLSAASIIYGLAQLITPVLATTEHLVRTLPCLGALHVYELALLGVLALIVVRRNVNEDGPFLVVLVALFLAASGLVLAAIANDKPVVAAALGVVSVTIGAGKLLALQRAVKVPIERWHVVGLAVLIGWNYLMAPATALVRKFDVNADALMRVMWLGGWLVVLAGSVLLLLQTMETLSGDARRRNVSVPVLRAPAMAWTFVLVFLAGVHAQQYALTYIFDVPFRFGDFVPAIALAAVLAVELMRAFGKRSGATEIAVALVPLAVVVVTVVSGGFVTPRGAISGLVWSPPVMLGVTALLFAWLAVRNGRPEFFVVAAAYTLGIVLTLGVEQGIRDALNWQPALLALAAALLVAGIAFHKVNISLAGVLVTCVWVALSPKVRGFVDTREVPLPAIIGLAAGLGVMAVYAIFPKGLSRWFAVLGAAILASSAIGCVSGRSALDYPVLGGIAVAVVGGGVWLRTRDVVVAAVSAVPLLRGLYITTQRIKGWRYIALSFVLLAVGALISLRKGQAKAAPDHSTPS
ncbi:MAG: hypothetical protein JW889_14640 [Verrucomicrobia bacterium]|nr:hypothetical protein [Verrucomicrobiota bacterium]